MNKSPGCGLQLVEEMHLDNKSDNQDEPNKPYFFLPSERQQKQREMSLASGWDLLTLVIRRFVEVFHKS